jgi:hypothetical protein
MLGGYRRGPLMLPASNHTCVVRIGHLRAVCDLPRHIARRIRDAFVDYARDRTTAARTDVVWPVELDCSAGSSAYHVAASSRSSQLMALWIGTSTSLSAMTA